MDQDSDRPEAAQPRGAAKLPGRLLPRLTGWADAAFELTDAALCLPTPVASVPALCLEPVFRRSHGSLYKALARGDIDAEAMRDLLVAYRPADWPAVFAVDAQQLATLRRRDQPAARVLLLGLAALRRATDRGRLVLPVGHPAGLGERLLDRAGGRPADPAHRGRHRCHRRPGPRAGRRLLPAEAATADVRLRRRLRPHRADRRPGRHRAHPGAASATTASSTPTRPTPGPAPSAGPAGTAPAFGCAEPTSWPAPDAQLTADDPATAPCRSAPGTACTPSSPAAAAGPTTAAPPIVAGTVIRVAVEHLPKPRPAPRRRCGCGGRTRRRPRRVLARLPAPLRHRTHLPIRQEHPRLDHPRAVHPRAGRPLDLADRRRLHPTAPRPQPRRRPPPALGTTPPTRPAHPRPGPSRVSPTPRTPSAPPPVHQNTNSPGPGRPKGTRRPPRTRYPAIKKAA